MSTPTTKEAIEYARKLTPDCWSDEVIKVLFLAVEEHLCRAEHAEAELAASEADYARAADAYAYAAAMKEASK